MKYVLPLQEQDYRRVVSMLEGNSDFALFKINKVLYVLCHSNTCGMVQVDEQMMSLEELLTMLLKHGIADDGLIGVRTISCYGAYQQYVTIDGLTIGPEFSYKGTIDMKVHVDMNYSYSLIIEESKGTFISVA